MHFQCTLKTDTVRKYEKHKPGQKPKRVRRPCYIDLEEEEKLVCLVEVMLKMKISVYQSTLFSVVNRAIKGTEYEKLFPSCITKWWYY